MKEKNSNISVDAAAYYNKMHRIGTWVMVASICTIKVRKRVSRDNPEV